MFITLETGEEFKKQFWPSTKFQRSTTQLGCLFVDPKCICTANDEVFNYLWLRPEALWQIVISVQHQRN
jgi:hypothetical protein